MKTNIYLRVRDAFLAAIDEYGMLKKADNVLVGFSGGADSSLLLILMKELCDARGLRISAAHMNHMIRGAEADRDEDFCAEVCGRLGIPLTVSHTDIPALAAASKRGIEETARDARYAFFAGLCDGGSLIAVAHNATDNLETVLFNLTRGTGIAGLCGIPPVRDNIIRPLITSSKEDILSACAEAGIAYVSDSTNSDTGYSRNLIRAEVIPALRRINPQPERSVARTVRHLRADRDVLAREAARHSFSEGREALAALPDALLSRVILNEYTCFSPEGEAAEDIHASGALALIRSTESGQVSFPCGSVLQASGREVCFTSADAVMLCPEYDLALSETPQSLPDGSGVVFAAPSRESAAEILSEYKNIYKLSISQAVNSAKIKGAIRCGSRREGERVLCGSMHKSVKKLLGASKMSLYERSRLPLFRDDAGVVWIPGIALRDDLRGSDGGDVILCVLLNE